MKATTTVDIFEKLIKELQEAGQTDIFKNSVDSLKGLKGQIDATNKLMLEMGKAGDTRGAMRLIDAANRARESQVEATNNLVAAREKLSKINKETDTKAYDAQLKVIAKVNQEIDKLARQSVQMQKNAAEFTKSMDHSLLQYDNLLQSREDRYRELGKAGQVFEEKFANRFEGAVGAFTSGVGDLESIGDSFGKGLEKFGSYLQQRAGKAADLAKQGKGGTGMAKMLGTFSKVAATTAVVAGSVMALVKLFNFVEGQVKELNKEILQGHTGIELMAVSGKGMAESLKTAREELGGMKGGQLANDLGILRADVMGLVNNLADMNMNLRYFGGNFDSLKDSMKQLKGFGEGLGIGFEGAAEYMEKFAVDMGVAAGEAGIISKMEQEFAAIRDMALQSSYSTKNFFNQVKELTDQLQSMNNRSEEAGNLFNRFAKIVGPKGVGALLQGLAAGFRSESYLDLIKRQMLTKGKDISDALQVEANRTAKAFMDTYMEQLKQIDKDSAAGKQLQAMGITAADMTPQKLVQILGKMSSKDRQKLLGALSLDPKGAGAGRALDDLFDASRGARKGATKTDKSRAMRRAGGASAMAMKFATVQRALRKANISDASGLTLEAAKAFGLTNQEELDQFKQIQETMKGQLAVARERVQRGKGESEADYNARMRSKENEAFLKQMGLAVKDGQLVMLDQQNKKVDSVLDMILASGAVEKKEDADFKQHQMTTEDYLAQQVVETQAISDRINNHIGGILQTMSAYLFGILNWTQDDEEAKGTRQKVQSELLGEQERARKAQKTSRQNINTQSRVRAQARREMMRSDAYKNADRSERANMLRVFDDQTESLLGGDKQKLKAATDKLLVVRQALKDLANVNIDYTGYGQLNAEQTRRTAYNMANRTLVERGQTGHLTEEMQTQLENENEQLRGTRFKSVEQLALAVRRGRLTEQDHRQLNNAGFQVAKDAVNQLKNEDGDGTATQYIGTGRIASMMANQTMDAQGAMAELMYQNPDAFFAGAGVSIFKDGKLIRGSGLGIDERGAANPLENIMEFSGEGSANQPGNYRAKGKDIGEMAALPEGVDALIDNTEPMTEADYKKRAENDAKYASGENKKVTKEGVLEALTDHEEATRTRQLNAVAQDLGINTNGKSQSQIAALIAAKQQAGFSDEEKSKLAVSALFDNPVATRLLGSNADLRGLTSGGGGSGLGYVEQAGAILAEMESDYGKDSPEYKQALKEYNEAVAEKRRQDAAFEAEEAELIRASEGDGPPNDAEPVEPKAANDLLITANGEVWRLNRQDRYTPLGGGFAFSKPGGEIDQYVGRRMSASGRGGNTFDIDIVVNGAATNDETGRIIALKIKEAMRQYMGD